MLVEPHGDTRELYHLWLTQCGFKVTAASSAAEAVAAAHLLPPDVVVVEPMVADGGVPLVQALRRERGCADTALIVLTTQASAVVRRHALEAGADAYLVKPCGVNHLGEAIASASRHRLRLVVPDAGGAPLSRDRVRRAVQRYRAIGERLQADRAVLARVGQPSAH